MFIFRFAPSPNGLLHLGHAYCALLNEKMARESGGICLLRMEDIDKPRCRAEFYHAIEQDLAWLGLHYPQPVRCQSQHFSYYRQKLHMLIEDRLVYPAFLTRGAVRQYITQQPNAQSWPHDPDGTPLYPTFERNMSEREAQKRIEAGEAFAWRLNMEEALKRVNHPLTFTETGQGAPRIIDACPQIWGDVILARSDIAASYHLCVVCDDALQQVSHVVRGCDLFSATHLHRLLQHLFQFPTPLYHHHRLICDETGQKLSKTTNATSLQSLRKQGVSIATIQNMLNHDPAHKKTL